MDVLRFLFSFFSVVFFLLYWHSNVNMTGEAAGGSYIFLSIFLGCTNLIVYYLNNRQIYLKSSFLLLCVYLAYYLVKLIIDITELSEIKEATIGTTRGVFLALLEGYIISVCIYTLSNLFTKSLIWKNIVFISIFVLSFFYLYSLFVLLNELLLNIRDDVFLIKDVGAYQRPGVMLSIAYLVLSLLIVKTIYISKNKKISLFLKPIKVLYIVLYSAITITQCVISQAIASNSCLLFTVVLYLISIGFILLVFIRDRRLHNYGTLNEKKKYLYGFRWMPIVRSWVIGLISIVLIGIYLIYKFDFDISQTRVMGYGSGEVSSISSRTSFIEKYYPTHLSYNPIFGHLQVDELTTGKGTYAHSFLLATLSHMGVVGLILFLTFFYFAIQGLCRNRNLIFLHGIQNTYLSKAFRFYLIFILFCIFAIASLTTFIDWMPIWFAFGLILTSVYTKTNEQFTYNII